MDNKLVESVFAALVLVGLPYCLGFFFLNGYFAFFGVGINELNLSEREIFVASMSVISQISNDSLLALQSERILGTGILLSLLTFVLWLGGIKFPQAAVTLCFIVISGILLVLSASIADRAGSTSAKQDLSSLPITNLLEISEESKWISGAPVPKSGKVERAFDRLLYSSSETYFVVRQYKLNGPLSLIRVPKYDNLASDTMLPARKQ